jgi:hypothetical protein
LPLLVLSLLKPIHPSSLRPASTCPTGRPVAIHRDMHTSYRPVLCANPPPHRGAAGASWIVGPAGSAGIEMANVVELRAPLDRRAHAGHGALWGSMSRNGGRLDPPPTVPAARWARHASAGDTMPVLVATSRLAPGVTSLAFSAIGRNLVEQRVGEIASRARADEWGQTGAELRAPLGRRTHAGHDGGRLGAHPAVPAELRARHGPAGRPAAVRRDTPTSCWSVLCANPPPDRGQPGLRDRGVRADATSKPDLPMRAVRPASTLSHSRRA